MSYMKIKFLNTVLYLNFLTVVQNSWSLSAEVVWNLHTLFAWFVLFAALFLLSVSSSPCVLLYVW